MNLTMEIVIGINIIILVAYLIRPRLKCYRYNNAGINMKITRYKNTNTCIINLKYNTNFYDCSIGEIATRIVDIISDNKITNKEN